MHLSLKSLALPLVLLACLPCMRGAPPPAPFGPLPSARQLRWHELQFYAFIHFSINTFTDKEWGYGDESPALFNPTEFDADQIVGVIKEAGMRGVVLTCKHHDGFALWPSAHTEHSVKRSPWRDGQGDMVKEFSDACRRHGLEFGVYLSPWDCNREDYGTPAYIDYYRKQLRELLTNYGPIFEVWFDGANGGDGYYGGAREHRKIDARTYYDWDETWKIVRALQPDACLFGGPDVRWVGNEQGLAGEPCWATIDPEGVLSGTADQRLLEVGQRGGSAWLPAEVDVSIRRGWFYHAAEDERVKSAAKLVSIYYTSIGRGANLILNLPPDRRGRIHERDIEALRGMRRILDATFAENLARQATLKASHVRGGDTGFGADKVIDGATATYWSTDDDVTLPELVFEWSKPVVFDVARIAEEIRLGQRVEEFALDRWTDGGWVEFVRAASIGPQRLVRFETVETPRVRLRITKSPVCPAIAEFGLFKRP